MSDDKLRLPSLEAKARRLRRQTERAAREAVDAITVEPHGPGEAIYVGRDEHHHGLNVALVTEVDPARWPAVRERLCAMRLDGSEWTALYDALELVGDDRTPEGAARWARTYVAMARRSGWLP